MKPLQPSYTIFAMSLTRGVARTHKIASIPGDGIGVEVIEETIKVLRTIEALSNSFILDIDTLDWSSKRYMEQGEYIPTDGWQRIKKSDAILFGAVGSPGLCSIKKGEVLNPERHLSNIVSHLRCAR